MDRGSVNGKTRRINVGGPQYDQGCERLGDEAHVDRLLAPNNVVIDRENRETIMARRK
jgi:hypothetical protein